MPGFKKLGGAVVIELRQPIENKLDPYEKSQYTMLIVCDYNDRYLLSIRFYKFNCPFSLLYVITQCHEISLGLLRKDPFLLRYRLISSQRNIRYDYSELVRKPNWHQRVSVDQTIEKIINYETMKCIPPFELGNCRLMD
jgi:hypothetical protein